MTDLDRQLRLSLVLSAVWVLSALVIPVLSAFGRPLQHWVYREIGETIIAIVIGLSLLTLGAAAIYWQGQRGLKWNRNRLLLISLALVVMLVTITMSLPQTEERLHFVTFGLFGFYSKRLFPMWIALMAIVTLSAGDELFQAWLPDRVGDWRDVGINIMAGVIGFGFAWIGRIKKPVPPI